MLRKITTVSVLWLAAFATHASPYEKTFSPIAGSFGFIGVGFENRGSGQEFNLTLTGTLSSLSILGRSMNRVGGLLTFNVAAYDGFKLGTSYLNIFALVQSGDTDSVITASTL